MSKNPSARRRDWLLLANASAFKFSLVGFYLVAVMTMLKSYGYTLEQLSWVYLLSGVEAAKVLFAALVERFRMPRFGRFRFWLLLSSLGIAALLAVLMYADPKHDFALLLWLCLALSCLSVLFSSAVVGLSCVVLPYRQRGFGGVIQVVAARGGKIIGGALVLWIYQRSGWQAAVGAVLLFALIIVLQTACYREPPQTRAAQGFGFAVLFKRLLTFWRSTPDGKSWFALLLFCCFPYAFVAATFVPRLSDAGWQPAQTGSLLALAVPLACMVVTPAAGWLMRRVPRQKLLRLMLAAQVPMLASFVFAAPLAALHSWLPAVQIVLLSLGYTLLLPVVMTMVMDKSSPECTALDSSLQLSVLLVGTYAGGFVSLRLSAWAGYPAAYLAAACAAALLAAAVWRKRTA